MNISRLSVRPSWLRERAWVAVALLSTAVVAQGPYYVNGTTGSDVPGHGTSPATPWKTVTYAMGNVPPLAAQQSATIFVEGNQVYSPSSNGEVLPITPAYNYGLEGTFVGHGSQPVFRIPAGGSAFNFAGNRFYNRSQVTFRYLVFEGGAVALAMGASPGFRHRPQVQDCTFRQQSRTGVLIRNFGNAIEDPRFYRNTFLGGNYGVETYASGTGAIVQPNVDENLFDGQQLAGVYLNDQSPGGGNVGGSFQFNRFRGTGSGPGGGTGIHIETGAGAFSTNATILGSLFRDLEFGVRIALPQPRAPVVTIDQCVFDSCGRGIEMAGDPRPGPYPLTVRSSTIDNCGLGVVIDLDVRGAAGVMLSLASRDNHVRGCSVGYAIGLRGSLGGVPPAFAIASERDSILDCAEGVTLSATGNGSFRWLSGRICRSSLRGMRVGAANAVVTLGHLTLADHGQGLHVLAAGPGSSATNLVFDGNAQDLDGGNVLAPTYSCFASSSHQGAGNLNATNPRLVRPFYKLAPGSACIDAGSVVAPSAATDFEGDPRASVGRSGGQPLPDMGADEYVQAGSVRPYGTPGIAPAPRIGSPQSTCRVGSPLQVDLTGAAFSSTAILTVGLRDDSGGLPFHAVGLGFGGVYLWNEIAAVIAPVPVSNGAATYSELIPAAPALVGVTFTHQWLALVSTGSGIASSDGLRVTMGL